MEFWLIQDLPIVLTRFNFKFNILKISILIVIFNVNVVELMSKISQKKFQISIYGTQEATYMTNSLYWFMKRSDSEVRPNNTGFIGTAKGRSQGALESRLRSKTMSYSLSFQIYDGPILGVKFGPSNT